MCCLSVCLLFKHGNIPACSYSVCMCVRVCAVESSLNYVVQGSSSAKGFRINTPILSPRFTHTHGHIRIHIHIQTLRAFVLFIHLLLIRRGKILSAFLEGEGERVTKGSIRLQEKGANCEEERERE